MRDFSELLGWERGMGSPLRARQWRFLGSFREPKQDFGHGYTSLISVSLERVFSYWEKQFINQGTYLSQKFASGVTARQVQCDSWGEAGWEERSSS